MFPSARMRVTALVMPVCLPSLPQMKTLGKIARTGSKTCNKQSVLSRKVYSVTYGDIFYISNARHALLNREVWGKIIQHKIQYFDLDPF